MACLPVWTPDTVDIHFITSTQPVIHPRDIRSREGYERVGESREGGAKGEIKQKCNSIHLVASLSVTTEQRDVRSCRTVLWGIVVQTL